MDKKYLYYEKEFSTFLGDLKKNIDEVDRIEHVSENLNEEIERILYEVAPNDPVAFINYQYRLFSKIMYVQKEYQSLLKNKRLSDLEEFFDRLKEINEEIEKNMDPDDLDWRQLAESVRTVYGQLSNAISNLRRVSNYLHGDMARMRFDFYAMNNANKELSKYIGKMDVKSLLGDYEKSKDYVDVMLQDNIEFFKEALDPVERVNEVIEREKPGEGADPSQFVHYRNSLEWLKENMDVSIEKAMREMERIREAKEVMERVITVMEAVINLYNLHDDNPLWPILSTARECLEKLNEGEEELKELVESYRSRVPEAMRIIDEELSWVNERL